MGNNKKELTVAQKKAIETASRLKLEFAGEINPRHVQLPLSRQEIPIAKRYLAMCMHDIELAEGESFVKRYFSFANVGKGEYIIVRLTDPILKEPSEKKKGGNKVTCIEYEIGNRVYATLQPEQEMYVEDDSEKNKKDVSCQYLMIRLKNLNKQNKTLRSYKTRKEGKGVFVRRLRNIFDDLEE